MNQGMASKLAQTCCKDTLLRVQTALISFDTSDVDMRFDARADHGCWSKAQLHKISKSLIKWEIISCKVPANY